MLAHALHDHLEHAHGEVGVLFQQRAEVPADQLDAAGALLGRDGGGADPLLHERHLPEELSGPHVADAMAVAGDLNPSLHDEEEADTGIALLHDDRPRLVGALLHRPGDERQLLRGQPAKDGHPAEVLEMRRDISHTALLKRPAGLRQMFDFAWISPPATESPAREPHPYTIPP